MLELRIWLGRGLYERVSREAAIRGMSLSAVARTCLQEYFALRDELASSIEDDTGGQGIRSPSKTLHLLIAHAETRIRGELRLQDEELAQTRRALSKARDHGRPALPRLDGSPPRAFSSAV
jgi:hypothetical protein